MAECQHCDETYSDARADLGFDSCLTCGEKQAIIESHRKSMCVAPAFNKGPLTYIASAEQARDIGR